MTVDRVLKGSTPPELEFIAANTAVRGPGPDLMWRGSWGACGAFDFNPVGKYWIMGLALDEFGRYQASGPRVFYYGDTAPVTFIGPSLSRLAPLLQPGLPPGGGLPRAADSPSTVLLTAGILLTALGTTALAFASTRS